MKQFFKVITLCIICFQSYAQQEFEGKVTSIIDGNTLQVIDNYQDTITVILKGIDSPEMNQDYGDDAKAFTTKKCLGNIVKITLFGKDRFGNDMASVIIVRTNEDLGIALLKAGLAWYHHKAEKDVALANYETCSRDNKIGLWKTENPLEPWIFRRQQTMIRPKLSY